MLVPYSKYAVVLTSSCESTSTKADHAIIQLSERKFNERIVSYWIGCPDASMPYLIDYRASASLCFVISYRYLDTV